MGDDAHRIAALCRTGRHVGEHDSFARAGWHDAEHGARPGKIGIPDAILLKRGPLTDDEWDIMRRHPEIGYGILAGVRTMAEAAEIVLAHEERFDGSGYPRGLAGDAIPLNARLFAVIDTLDAMTSDRPYRAGMSFDAAKEDILREAGRQFDPMVVEAFAAEDATLRQMVAAKCSLQSEELHLAALISRSK